MSFFRVRTFIAAALPFALVFALVLSLLFYPSAEGERAEKRVVRVWHVDTFEGGKGSRAAFLMGAARRAEQREKGTYYLITSYTPEGAEAAMREGKFPDAISFGIGLSSFAERCLPLPYAFSGGEVGEECLAYPWCRGGYALFSLEEGFEEAGSVALSEGGRNLPEAAAALAGLDGEKLPSQTAYTSFLSGKFRYLLGTQRDLCRFAARGKEVFYRPLDGYCDLYQYFSVLNAEKRESALALLKELLSEETQGALTGIGMYPVGEESGFAPFPKATLGVFASGEALAEVGRAAREQKNIRKYLKTI